MNNEVLKDFSYGVYVVSTVCGERPTGCIVNSIMQVTYDTVAISVHHDNFTNKCIKDSGKFAVSILGVDVGENIIPVFGFKSGRDINKFENIDTINVKGLDIISDSVGYVVCDVTDTLDTETHTIFLGKILEGELLKDQIPMTYAYYHAVKKGISPKNAPTYQEVVSKAKEAYRCKVCGYIYEGDLTKEPDTYVCPICKQPKSVFEKIK